MNNRNLDLFLDGPPVGAGEHPPPTPPGAVHPAVRPRIWTVAQVNRAVRLLLEQTLSRLWVAGEVANFSRRRSGHCYFTLKDDAAQLRCVMFRREAARLPMDPEEGMTLRVFGRLTLYEARGGYQMVVSRLATESDGGMWKLALERLRKRLEAEGLTDPARKRSPPRFPRTVGVVSSLESAALRDILSVIGRRAPWVRLVVRGTRVQGEGASLEIAAAISILASRGVDVLIVARGGGSVEDLWSFNEEPVARAVAASPVPVISGVGHETDVTICDLVADLRAATPSAAAEAAVPELEAVESTLERLAQRLGSALSARARSRRRRLDRAHVALLRRLHRLEAASRDRLERGRVGMTVGVRRQLRHNADRLAAAAAAMEALSPLSTLARGYAVPLDLEGRLLRTIRDFALGQDFKLRVVDGNVSCTVTPPPAREAPEAAVGA